MLLDFLLKCLELLSSLNLVALRLNLHPLHAQQSNVATFEHRHQAIIKAREDHHR